MQPRFETIPDKQLAGRSARMSLARNGTAALWQSFMQQKKELKTIAGTDLYSVQVFDPGFDLRQFTPQTEFLKIAGAEVSSVEDLPEGIEAFTLPGGLYAVFLHKGGPSRGAESFRYIYGTWLPQSGYVLDERPHFEVLGYGYKGDHPDSEEEIWIPVRIRRD